MGLFESFKDMEHWFSGIEDILKPEEEITHLDKVLCLKLKEEIDINGNKYNAISEDGEFILVPENTITFREEMPSTFMNKVRDDVYNWKYFVYVVDGLIKDLKEQE